MRVPDDKPQLYKVATATGRLCGPEPYVPYPSDEEFRSSCRLRKDPEQQRKKKPRSYRSHHCRQSTMPVHQALKHGVLCTPCPPLLLIQTRNAMHMSTQKHAPAQQTSTGTHTAHTTGTTGHTSANKLTFYSWRNNSAHVKSSLFRQLARIV